MREWYHELRQGLVCADCGQTHPAILHFHHCNPAEKEFSISTAVSRGKTLSSIQKEISKSIVLCANCHAIRHYDHNKGDLFDLEGGGQFEQFETTLQISEEDEFIYCMYFNVDPV